MSAGGWYERDPETGEPWDGGPPLDDVWTREIRSPRPPDVDPVPSPERLAELRAMPYADYLKSDEWRNKRWQLIKLAQRKCERCGSSTRELQVHHLKYDRLGDENYEDLEVLCRPCHMREHGIAA